MNEFKAYSSIPLIDIVDGQMMQTVKCQEYTENFKPGKVVATINFMINLSEMWDFKLDFMDWKTSSLAYKTKVINPQMTVLLNSKQAIQKNVKSEILKNTPNPYWDILTDGQIIFRGTYQELKQQELLITLLDNSSLLQSDEIGSKLIPLKDVVDNSFAKTEMVIWRDKNKSDNEINRRQIGCTMQGVVQVGSFPRWRQQGDDDSVKFADQYLCVQINEANVFRDINDGGDAQAWVEVKWAGSSKRTKKFKKAFVNQILYFKMPIPSNKRKKPSELEAYLLEELKSNPELEINVWADLQKMSIDSMGSAKVCLSQIANNVQYQDREFVDPISKKKTVYQARVHNETVKLQSSFWFNANNLVTLSVWFQDDLPYPGVDLSKLEPQIHDKFPEEI